ncbi:MAG: VIT1/CCC1 transporter family protein, partial [Bradyrhizobium sp.]|nr:VIT1/CCC1 transporter family protein [Bradyrhizobium sp.]
MSDRVDDRSAAAGELYSGGRTWLRPRLRPGLVLLLLVAGGWFCFHFAEVDLQRLVRGLPRLASWAARSWPPDFSDLQTLLTRAAETLAMATLGTSLGALIALPLCVLAARNTSHDLTYLAARTDAEHYAAEERRENDEIDRLRGREIEEVAAIFRDYGLKGDALTTVVEAIAADRKRWVDFMMRFELGLERPDPKRAPVSAVTIGGSYVIGGLIPLIPY